MLTKTTSDLLHSALVVAVSEIRQALDTENIADLRLDIEISGRVTGDLRIIYKLGETYDTRNASSHNLLNCLKEFLRRHIFAKTNTAQLLSYVGEEKLDNEIKF